MKHTRRGRQRARNKDTITNLRNISPRDTLHTFSDEHQQALEQWGQIGNRVPQSNLPAQRNDKQSMKEQSASTKYFRPMKKQFQRHKNYFRPIKRHQNRKVTNHKNRPTQFCCKSPRENFRPITNHAWQHTVPSHQVLKPVPRRGFVANTKASTSHGQNDRGHHRHQDYTPDDSNNDEYLSQLKFLKHQHQQNIHKTMKVPGSTQSRNPLHPRPHKVKVRSLEERNIRLLIGEQRKLQAAKLIKHDAIIETQAQFFDALRRLYTWPLDQLTLAPISEVRTFWDASLLQARRCAYRAGKIDPNHCGHLRYDIMCEIVKLEHFRINEFVSTFEHFRDLIYTGDITAADENYCDDTMLSYLDPVQTNVILDITPTWIEETRRPPLTWYSFLTSEVPTHKEVQLEDRLLAPEYYD